jgi:CRISPR-associated endonuclease/helicase Cas3
MGHSCKFLSHPGLCLKDHLVEVGTQCRRKAIEIGVKDEELLGVIEIVGKFHDFGKYSEFFQEYLSHKASFKRELARHSALSALFSSWLVSKIYEYPFLSAVTFYSVYRHHSDLTEKVNDFFSPDTLENVRYQCQEQLSSIIHGDESAFREVDEIIRSLSCKTVDLTLKNFIEEYNEGLPMLKKIAAKFNLYYKSENIFNDFFSLCLVFSLLIDFDKKSAGGVQLDERAVYSNLVTADLVDEYIKQLDTKGKGRNPMNEMRAAIRRDAFESFQRMISDGSLGSQKIMTITAPTGSGKTLLSFTIATKLRELAQGVKPRIIYVLPYVNIVEQTYDVFKGVLGSGEVNLLLKHHHKAYGMFFRDQAESLSVEDMLLLTESWDSEVVVTTSVQLFETLLGTRNRMLKKFNELFNSIIILDEVQTLPIEYWRLVKEFLEKLVNSSNSYLIYMSATRPIIFEGQELIKDCEKYFRMLRRVSFKYVPRDLSIDEAVEFAFDKWRLKGSLLVVLNTIKSSINFYEKFKQLLNQREIEFATLSGDEDRIDRNKLVLSYLSTNIIPLHRMKRIKRIRELLKEGVKVVLVSTQVIEAGVDLDFDIGVRDIGPFDSIVQVAGRCNRNASREQSDFYVIRVVDEQGRLYAKKVYGKMSIEISEKILSKHSEFDEANIFDMISDYYAESIRVFGSESDEYRDVIKGIENLDFECLRELRIIKEEQKHPVFVEYDEEATRIKNELLKLIEERRQAERDRSYEMLARIRAERAELENYVVETWADVGDLVVLSELSNISHVGREDVEEFYDKETGLKRVEEIGVVFI